MPLHFFPRERDFWIYHCSAVAVGVMTNTAIAVAWGFMVTVHVCSSLAWIPFYTLAVLILRWLYKRRGGDAVPIARLIAIVVLYSAVAGLVIGACVTATVAPLFLKTISAKYKKLKLPVIPSELMVSKFMDEAPKSQLFVAVWGFIYISVSSSRRIKKAEVFNLRLQNNLKEAQLSSLSNQLNPHFLFNSLNNIRFMIHEDAQRADAMITSFSDILRYSLESTRHEKVSLHHEVGIISKYLAIVRTQLEERLDFSLHIAPGLDDALMPPMVLQMLVENAIKHGLDQLQGGGTLTVSAARHDQSLLLEVRNDAPDTPARTPGCTGIGLLNIEQRLHLLYGELAALSAVHAGGVFKVSITLPLERAA
ncbi:sensor histidine kinase [Massilia antarctica]|uniref:sensor histidine kinase n=1 Tax=Massilia antarctica TaxID=2765360 RepID=UPI0006BB77FF|nr:histidine kinase [Massilia sp. H27-R4]MCY0911501.1 histidine kinase [Massilia sp. H27-R4]CUI04892.1 Autolysin sensor kinase [Janthinobacterium sp. CG23_2]CUU28678.1 Autolysin sensor kinase [Janthinobacterium sp. CG23_2]